MIATPDLMGAWPFEDSADDASGNGNHGTVFGAGYVDGVLGRALSFSANDYVNCGHDASLNIVSQTLAAWIYVTDRKVASHEIIVGKGTNMNTLRLSQGKIYGHFKSITSISQKRASALVDENVWRHVAAVYDDATKITTLYIDGVEPAYDIERTGAGAKVMYPDDDERIGGHGGYYFEGYIDDVRIYDRALSVRDIRRIMLGLHPLGC